MIMKSYLFVQCVKHNRQKSVIWFLPQCEMWVMAWISWTPKSGRVMLKLRYGLSQGFMLSLYLFDIYFDVALREIAVRFNLTNDDMFTYADDLLFIVGQLKLADDIQAS